MFVIEGEIVSPACIIQWQLEQFDIYTFIYIS